MIVVVALVTLGIALWLSARVNRGMKASGRHWATRWLAVSSLGFFVWVVLFGLGGLLVDTGPVSNKPAKVAAVEDSQPSERLADNQNHKAESAKPADEGDQAASQEDGPKHYSDLYAAMADYGDYEPEYKELARIEGGVRVSPLVFDGDSPDIVRDMTARAAVDATYMAFALTDAQKVHILAYPMKSDIRQTYHKPLDAPRHEWVVTRSEAANAANQLVGMQSFEELYTRRSSFDVPSKMFNQMLYADQGPGPRAVAEILNSAD